MVFNRHLIVGFALALTATACRRESDDHGSAKSLDNMTRDAGQVALTNRCGIDLAAEKLAALSPNERAVIDKRIVAPTEELKLAVAGALAAVPKPMQSMLFAAPTGRIHVVEDARASCATEEHSEAERWFFAESDASGSPQRMLGCWSAKDGALAIYLPADVTAIRHGLVRVFAATYVEFFEARLLDSEDPAHVAAAAALRAERRRLGDALIADLKAMDLAKAERFARLRAGDLEAFDTRAFAETVDSAHCSAATKARLEADFPQVSALYLR